MFLKGPASSFTERRRTFSEPQKSQIPVLSLCSLTYLFNHEWEKQSEQQNISIPRVCWFPVLHDTNSCSLARVLRGRTPSLAATADQTGVFRSPSVRARSCPQRRPLRAYERTAMRK